MWLALVWPSIAVLVLLAIPDLRKKVASFEYFLPWVPVLALVPIGIAIGRHVQVTDYETLGGYATAVRKWEAWDEEVPCRHPKYKTVTVTKTRTVGSGKDARTESYTDTETVQDGYEHMYDVDYHPEWKELVTTLGDRATSDVHYDGLVRLWGNPVFYDQHRSYHSIDGDMWQANFPGTWSKIEPVFDEHAYENRTQVAHSLYKFDPIDPKETPVYKKPGAGPFILGPFGTAADQLELARINSQVGPHNQCIIWICGWKNVPQSVGVDQQHFWKGGAKNELVITFSVDDKNMVQWAFVFSWMDNQSLSYDIRDHMTDKPKLNIPDLLQYTRKQVESRWERKQFSKNAPDGGFSFINVDPPFWLVVVIHVLSILASAGVGFYVCVNDVDDSNDPVWDWLSGLFDNARGNVRTWCEQFRIKYGR